MAAPRPDDGDGEQKRADDRDDDQARHRPARNLRGRKHIGDEEERRKEIEEPVREDGADEGAARSGPVRQAAPEDRDSGELADPARQHRVCEEADREGREDAVEPWPRRVERLVDRVAPSERAREHGDEIEPEREGDPGPVDEIERVIDDVPIGSAPPEQEPDDDHDGDEQRRARPAATRHDLHAATGVRTPRASS
jgi:hypothetical protein